jgi:HAD superfamily phosphoserine phosphatase-like hydrolase
MNEKHVKMVVLDMDNIVLQSRFIDTCAEHFNFSQALKLLRTIDKNPISLTVRIASFLHGKKKTELIDIADNIPMDGECVQVISALKQKGYRVGILSDSYQVITDHIAKKTGADFSYANELQFTRDIATGEVLIPSLFHYSDSSLCRHQICKTNALLYACNKYNLQIKDCIVVGDSDNDVCMVSHAGQGVALGTASNHLVEAASRHISDRRFGELLNISA